MKKTSQLLHTLFLFGILSFGSSFVIVRPGSRNGNFPVRLLQSSSSSTSDLDKPHHSAEVNHLFDLEDDQQNTSKSWTLTKDGNFLPNLQRKKIIQVTTLEEYKREVGMEQDRMVCVRFFSSTCRACKAAEPMFRRLTLEYPSVKFVEVPLLQENAYMLKGLGVPSFPYVHLYAPEVGLVEEHKINRKVFSEFQTILQQYVDGQCPVEM